MKEHKDNKTILLGRPGNHVKMGIVGMPNIGKSSLFNALSTLSVPAENFPFCTIEPSTSKVSVSDKRFDYLCSVFNPKNRVKASLSITDIAGLVKGAAEGNGLGNAFLSHINAVDGIYHVVRAFKDKKVEHVEGDVNPIRDLDIITNELFEKDIQFLEKKIQSSERFVASSKDKRVKDDFLCYQKVLSYLKERKDLKSVSCWSSKDIETINSLQLLTAKPIVYLVNVSLNNWKNGSNKWIVDIKKWVSERSSTSSVIPFCAEFEKEVASHKTESDKMVFIKESGMKSHLNKIIHSGYSALQLIHFFTCGQDEVKCWTIRKSTKSKQAAGVIHTDFEKGFICAEVMSYKDFKEFGSEQKVKSNGKYRTEGKDYVVEDGDIIFFKHNAGGSNTKKNRAK